MRRNVSKWLVVLGVLLVVLSGGWLLHNHLSAKDELENTTRLLQHIDTLLPERSAGVVTDTDRPMPELTLEGYGVVAVLELPAYGVRLPVGNRWEEQSWTAHPQRFSGTVYNQTLVIGGSDRAGQLECLSRMEIGDTVTITDMTGGVFTYEVARVDRSDSAEAEKLADPTAHLTLFVRDAYSLEYILVRCTAK